MDHQCHQEQSFDERVLTGFAFSCLQKVVCYFRGKATKFYLPRELDNHQIAAVKGSHHDWAAQEGATPSTSWYLVTINSIVMLVKFVRFW